MKISEVETKTLIACRDHFRDYYGAREKWTKSRPSQRSQEYLAEVDEELTRRGIKGNTQ